MAKRTLTTTQVTGVSGRIDPVGTDRIELPGLFEGEVPFVVGCLVHSLRQLDQNAESIQFDTIGIIYRSFVEEVDDSRRQSVFRYLVQEVEAAEQDPMLLLAFVRYEPHHRLVCQAVRAYLQNHSASFEDPFAAAHAICDILTLGDVVNRGAAYGGLILFGDRRVCAIARTIRDTISPEDARSFARTVTSPLYRSSVEFCLTWLVDLVAEKRYEIAKQICSALELMAVTDARTPLQDYQYNFGPFGFRSATSYADVQFRDLLFELMPMLESLAQERQPVLNQMIEIFKSPASSSYDQIGTRLFDRRDRDRRMTRIPPGIERRVRQRRAHERRVLTRRAGGDVNDRRTVDITPNAERRTRQNTERRTHQRRASDRSITPVGL